MARLFSTLSHALRRDEATSAHRVDVHREWDRMLANATSPAERDEINAIFSRSL